MTKLDFKDWKDKVLWSKAKVLAFLEKTESDFLRNRNYENLSGLSGIENTDIFPGTFEFINDKIEFIYIPFWRKPMPSLPDDMNIPPYGPPSAELSSRAGKTFTQYVWPEQGFSIATNHHEIGFIEVFHPTTLEDYKAKFWTDPEWHKKFNK